MGKPCPAHRHHIDFIESTRFPDQEPGKQRPRIIQRLELFDHLTSEGLTDGQHRRTGARDHLETGHTDRAPMWVAPDHARLSVADADDRDGLTGNSSRLIG